MTARWLTCLAAFLAAMLPGYAPGAAQGPEVLHKLHELKGHDGHISGVRFAPEEEEIVTWSQDDGTMRFWNAKTGQQKEILTINLQVRGPGQDAKNATETKLKLYTVMPWGTNVWLFHSTLEQGWGVWNRTKRNFGTFYKLPNRTVLAHHVKGPEAVLVLLPVDDRNSGPPVLWEVKSVKQLRRLAGPRSPAKLAQFSPDGKYILTYSPGDKSLYLWSVATGKQMKRLGKAENVTSFTFTPDGKQAVSGAETISVWDLATGKELRQIELPEGATVASGGNGLAVSPDGKRLWVVTHKGEKDCTLRLFDLETGNLIARADRKFESVAREADHSVAVSPDGLRVVTYGGSMADEKGKVKTATVWELPGIEDRP
jgi:WD40 repeat protein